VKIDEPNATTYKAMEKAEKREDIYGPFDSVEEMMKTLDAQS
jgi:DNA-damage-inducible protein J